MLRGCPSIKPRIHTNTINMTYNGCRFFFLFNLPFLYVLRRLSEVIVSSKKMKSEVFQVERITSDHFPDGRSIRKISMNFFLRRYLEKKWLDFDELGLDRSASLKRIKNTSNLRTDERTWMKIDIRRYFESLHHESEVSKLECWKKISRNLVILIEILLRQDLNTFYPSRSLRHVFRNLGQNL